jgi:hypothetical protein
MANVFSAGLVFCLTLGVVDSVIVRDGEESLVAGTESSSKRTSAIRNVQRSTDAFGRAILDLEENPLLKAEKDPKCSTGEQVMAHLPEEMQGLIKKRVKATEAAKFACPVNDTMDAENVLDSEKYKSRASSGQCEEAQGVWQASYAAPVIRCKYETIADLLGLGKGDLVLDMGAGCSHAIDMLAASHGFDGWGMDIIKETVDWANVHMTNLKGACQVDGNHLEFIANNTVDALLSNAALYHLPKKDQCKFARETLRILKVGACSWHGWLGTDHHENETTVEKDFWVGECFTDPDEAVAVVVGLEEHLFGVSEYGRGSFSLLFCKTG